MNDELLHLKNLGKTSAQWLHAVGIHNASDLRRLGPSCAPTANVRPRNYGPCTYSVNNRPMPTS